MLIKISDWAEKKPVIKKRINGLDLSHHGSFECGEDLEFIAEVPRSLGASAVVLRICRDGESDRDLPFSFTDSDGVRDIYALSIDTAEICAGEGSGLFFYELLFLRGLDTLFTNTHNNVDFDLSLSSQGRFTMLIYRKELRTPEWFHGRTMYQIFVDRFNKGSIPTEPRADVIMNDDWHSGVPQYAEIQGEDVANNMFFGGTLWGVREKLPYLRSLGIGILYLSPVFRAYSNHKYDTADYAEVDLGFGGESALRALLDECGKYDIIGIGMKV